MLFPNSRQNSPEMTVGPDWLSASCYDSQISVPLILQQGLGSKKSLLPIQRSHFWISNCHDGRELTKCKGLCCAKPGYFTKVVLKKGNCCFVFLHKFWICLNFLCYASRTPLPQSPSGQSTINVIWRHAEWAQQVAFFLWFFSPPLCLYCLNVFYRISDLQLLKRTPVLTCDI